MAKFYWNGGEWVEKKPRIITESTAPAMLGDLPEYQSPLSFKMVDGRRARREEMAKYDVRELDPSERPEGAGERKGEAQLKSERKYMAERAADTYNMPAEMRERLLNNG